MTGKVGSSPPEPDLTGRGGSSVALECDETHFMPVSPQKCNDALQSVVCDCSEDSVEQHGHRQEEQNSQQQQQQQQQVSGGTCGGGGCCSNLDPVADITRGHLTLFLGDAVELVQVNQFFANVKGVLEHSETPEASVFSVAYDPAVIGPRTLLNCAKERFPEACVFKSGSKDEDKNAVALRRSQRKVAFGVIICIPLFAFAFVLPHVSETMFLFAQPILGVGVTISMVVGFFLSSPIMVVLGFQVFYESYRSLRYERRPNMSTLVSISVITSYVYSVSMTIASFWISNVGELFYETGPILLTLVLLGRLLEQAAIKKTKNVLAALQELQPLVAVLYDETVREMISIDLDLVQPDDLVHVEPGSRIPTDGVVVSGSSSVDESMLTGESMHIPKNMGDQVFGGSLNQDGVLRVKVSHIASQSTLANVCAMVQGAQQGKIKSQRIADRISSYFVPAALIIAALTLTIWLLLERFVPITTASSYGALAIQFFITVLVIACPCAVALAVPTAIVVATGVAAKNGILIKAGESLEKAGIIDTIVFDKTGTLTQGALCVSSVTLFGPWNDNETHLLSLLASAESNSEHVVAKAVMDYVTRRGIDWTEPTDFINTPGMGVSCHVGRYRVLAGNGSLLEEHRISQQGDALSGNLHETGFFTFIYVAINGQVAATVDFRDAIRKESFEVVHWLKERGLQVWMVSGDSQHVCDQVASELGIAHVRAGVLPAGKASIITQLQETRGRKVAMVGDGINDSVALAQSDLGIAMGGGTDLAIETADIVMIRSGVAALPIIFDLARVTFRRIKFNFGWAIFYNSIAIVLAAGVLYPVGAVIPPAAAGAGEIISIMPVLFASLLLRYYKSPLMTPPPAQELRIVIVDCLENL